MNADAGPAWNAWTRITPVVTTRSSARYVRVRIPPAIGPSADGGYPDVRVIDDAGHEVPFALDPMRPAASDRDVPLIDLGFVPHRGTQGVLDLGASGALVDAVALDIDTSRRATFFERVALDASDDRRTWRIVRDDAIVYRVAQDGGHGSATLTFPPTRSRWLRVRVLDPGAAFPLTGASVAATASREPALVALPFAGTAERAPRSDEQRWIFSAPYAVRPTAVAFADGGAFYARTVTAEASDDGKMWTEIGDGSIARFAEGGAQTTVALTETTARFIRVTVHNGNDAPLAALRPSLLARPHDLVFARATGSFRLISGNPAAQPPAYDLGARLAHEDWRAGEGRVGSGVANAGWRDPRPVGERFPWLVTVALIAIAILLGGVALRTVRRPASE